jgi:methylated-DNA-[protein]-cysteine S-methyltransferase
MAETVVSTFETPLGWIALVGQRPPVSGRPAGGKDYMLKRVAVGFPSAAAARENALGDGANGTVERNWCPDLEERLSRYAAGEPVEFDDIAVDLGSFRPFARRVYDCCRRLGYGQRATYAELARLAGSPRAARAVGNVMASNPYPLVIPCHRVVASGGGLGGYSSPQGLGLKARLLEMEAAGCLA